MNFLTDLFQLTFNFSGISPITSSVESFGVFLRFDFKTLPVSTCLHVSLLQCFESVSILISTSGYSIIKATCCIVHDIQLVYVEKLEDNGKIDNNEKLKLYTEGMKKTDSCQKTLMKRISVSN